MLQAQTESQIWISGIGEKEPFFPLLSLYTNQFIENITLFLFFKLEKRKKFKKPAHNRKKPSVKTLLL